MHAPQLAAWLQLWRVPGVGPKTYLRLLHHFDNNPGHVLAAKPKELVKFGLPYELAQRIGRQSVNGTAPDITWMHASPDHHILTLADAAYPPLLREIATPPPVLFVKGDPAVLSQPLSLAVVGSRVATALGLQNAFQLSKELATLQIPIVSGLAAGIDGQAHRGALAANKGKTIAVLAHGPDRVYPAQHRPLNGEISAQGAVVSEFSPGTRPKPQYFPRRNRIISGLCHGTVIVEASARSGSLITARFALEQNREIFALPGPINSRTSEGCHRLIQEGAKLVTGVEDILLECPQFRGLLVFDRSDVSPQASSLAAVPLLGILDYVPMPIDELIEKSGLTPEQVSSMLIELEMNGHVTCDANGLYSRSALE